MTSPEPFIDALRLSMARVVADTRREFEAQAAESRAVIAELRLEVAGLQSQVKAFADAAEARIADCLAAVKDGETPELPDIGAMVSIAVSGAVGALPEPQNGKDADPAEIEALREQIAAVRADIPVVPEPADIGPLEERLAATEARLEAVEARDVVGELRPQIDAVARAVEALPGAPDLSGFATKDEVDAVRAAIPELPPPADLSGFATKGDIEALSGLIPAPFDPAGLATKEEVEAVRAAIPEVPPAPDLSGFASLSALDDALAALPQPKSYDADIAAMAARIDAIQMPEVIHGKDADPEVIRGMVDAVVAEAVAAIPPARDGNPGKDADPEEIRRMIAEAMPPIEALRGPEGRLPVARAWADGVSYEGAVVTHGGALWQATKDTGREPPHADWICLAAAGSDGRTPEFVGTFDEAEEYRRLDVVALNGGSFVALRDAPGACPGDGWQLVAGRGKTGPAVKGDKGDQGKSGPSNSVVFGEVTDSGFTLTNADGSVVEVDLYPLLSRLG